MTNNDTLNESGTMARIETRIINGKTLFTIVVPSPVIKAGICQGEYKTKAEAVEAFKDWN